MSTIEASLRLEIKQYQQQLAKAEGEAGKFKDSVARRMDGIEKIMLGRDQRYRETLNNLREQTRQTVAAMKAEMADMRMPKDWGIHKADMAGFHAQMRGTGRTAGEAFGKDMIAGLSRTFAPAVVAGVVTAALTKGARMAMDREVLEVQLEVLVGNKDGAKQFLDEMKTLAAESPLEMADLIGAGRNLIAFGESAETVPETLRRIGDVSLGVGASIGEIAEIYGKARVQGTLFAEDINQLTGRGIPVIQEFAKALGVGEGQIKKLASEGKVGFELLEAAMIRLTEQGGKFNGMMGRLADTNKGKSDAFMDELRETATEAGKMPADAWGGIASGLTVMLKTLKGSKDAVGDMAEAQENAQKAQEARSLAAIRKAEALEKEAREKAKQQEKEKSDAALKAQLEAEEKRRAALRKTLEGLREQARDLQNDMLPDEQRLAKLKQDLGEVFFNEQLRSGPTANPSMDWLKDRTALMRSSGNLGGEQQSLNNLKEALQIQKQIMALQESMKRSADAEAERAAREAQVQAEEMLRKKEEERVAINERILTVAEMQKQMRFDELTVEEKLADIRQQMADKQSLLDSGLVNARTRLDIEAEILRLLKQEKALMDEKAREDKEAANRSLSLAEYKEELRIQELLNQGKTKQAEAAQRDLDIQREKRRLMEQMHLSEQEALRLAEQRVDLERQGRNTGGGGGYDSDGRRSDGHKRIVSRRDGTTKARESEGNRSGLDEFYERNRRGRLNDEFKTPGLDAYNELQKRSQENAARQDGGGGDRNGAIVQQAMALLQENLPKIAQALTLN